MSQERSGSPFVTPTFQAVLNKQLAEAMDAINDGSLFRAYAVMKTLIDALKPKDRDELLENDVKHIDARIGEALRIEGVDLYQTRRARKSRTETIIRRNIRLLFRKVMTKLHQGGYLEKQPVQPRARGKGRIRINE